MTDYHRITTLFAAFFTLIQGIGWLAISILAIGIYNCNVDFPIDKNNDEVAFIDNLTYIAYFTGPCIGNNGEELPGPAFRTHVFMIIYAVFSALWIPVSILLIAGVFLRVKGAKGVSVYSPWVILTSVIQLIDLVGSIVYGIDISNTKTVKEYEQFISPLDLNKFFNSTVIDSSYLDGLTVLPSIFMTIFFSRAIIIWIINVILLGVVTQALKTMKKKSMAEPSKRVTSIRNGNISDTRPYINSNEDRMMNPQQNRYFGENYPRNSEGADVTPMRNANFGDKSPVIYSQVNKRVNPQQNRFVGERKPLEITNEDPERVYIPGSRDYYRGPNHNQGYVHEEPVPYISNNYPQQSSQTPAGQQRALGWSYIKPQEFPKNSNLRPSNDPWIPEPDYLKGAEAPRRQIIPRVQPNPLSGPGNTGGY